jgi:hypothetical protein
MNFDDYVGYCMLEHEQKPGGFIEREESQKIPTTSLMQQFLRGTPVLENSGFVLCR